MKTLSALPILFMLIFVSLVPMRVLAQSDLEQRVERLEHKAAANEGVGVAVFVCAAFCALWAQNTGRNAWLWFFLGLFFNVISLLVMLYKNSNDKGSDRRK